MSDEVPTWAKELLDQSARQHRELTDRTTRPPPPPGISWRTVGAVVSAVVAVLGVAWMAFAASVETIAGRGDAIVLEKLADVAKPLDALIVDLDKRVAVLEDREDRKPKSRRRAADEESE